MKYGYFFEKTNSEDADKRFALHLYAIKQRKGKKHIAYIGTSYFCDQEGADIRYTLNQENKANNSYVKFTKKPKTNYQLTFEENLEHQDYRNISTELILRICWFGFDKAYVF